MFGTLRFVLAVNVVLFHILGISYVGPYAVYSFFVLSGFLMTAITVENYGYTLRGMIKYALNRFFRLYPVYWTLILISLGVIWFTGTEFAEKVHFAIVPPNGVGEWASNLLLIFPAIRPIEIVPRMAPATWALTIELFYYALIGLGLSRNKPITLMWFGASILYFLFSIAVFQGLTIGYGSLFSASVPFSLGALLFHYRIRINQTLCRISPFVLPCVLLLFVANIVFSGFLTYMDPNYRWKFGALGTYVNLALTALLIPLLFHYRMPNFKAIDKFLGDLSYPIYVFHWTGAIVAAYLFSRLTPSPPHSVWVFAVGIVVTISISVIVNRLVNEPVERIRSRVKTH